MSVLIPVVVISYNNWKYVDQMILQLLAKLPDASIWIIDNASTCLKTRAKCTDEWAGLGTNVRVTIMEANEGHNVFQLAHIFNQLPNHFAVTDPDLELSSSMPSNALQVLAEITDEFKVGKAGCALRINASKINDRNNEESNVNGFNDGEHAAAYSEVMYSNPYIHGRTIHDWESQFWERPLTSTRYPSLDVYDAPIDTTFAVYNKQWFQRHGSIQAIRVSGNFECRHLPWFPFYNHANFSRDDVLTMYGNSGTPSTTASLILSDPFYK